MRRVAIIALLVSSALAVPTLASAEEQASSAPRIVEAPALLADPVVGVGLVATVPVVDGAHADDVTLVWERALGGGPFASIADAHETTYVPQSADVDARLRICARVETAGGVDEACSPSSAPVLAARTTTPRVRLGRIVGLERVEYAFAGGTIRADVDLARWTVDAGTDVLLRGTIAGEEVERAWVRLEPTVPGAARWAEEAEAIVADDGRIEASLTARANSVVVLRVASEAQTSPVEIHVGVLGVRPRIVLRLGARPAGRDAAGRRLIRDLRVQPGSTVAPAVGGLRLRWEGILPGQRRATSVCRRDEGVVSGVNGALRGRCAAVGAWASARWRLVYDPGTDDPGATAWLPATSAWTRPRTAAGGHQACATLPAWNSPRCSA